MAPRKETPPSTADLTTLSGIRDNASRGSVGDFLRTHITPGTSLSIVSAYVTIYAFDALKDCLLPIERLRFLYGEPRGIRTFDPEKGTKKAFAIVDEELQLTNHLQQKRVARECANWIQAQVDIRSIRQANLLHGKMYHIAQNGQEAAILGSSNFTMAGLGLGSSGNNIELNLEVDSNRDRRDLNAWFDERWESELVEDVRDDVLAYLAQIYANTAPQFLSYKTLFHLFGL